MQARTQAKGSRWSRGRGVGPILVSLGLAAVFAGPAMGVQAANNSKGDVWVDNVGQPSGPGHEMDPHLACQDINLWGDALADPSGTYTIDGWPPSGAGAGDQAWPGTAAHPGNASWSYAQGTGGNQVISVINVSQLIANAVANGDAPVNKQGFHFKLQFSQDPQKHKTFWVDCGPTPPGVSDCDGDQDSSDCSPGGDCDEAPQQGTAACVTAPAVDCDGNTDASLPTDSDCAAAAAGGTNGSGAGAGGVQAATLTPGLPRAGGAAPTPSSSAAEAVVQRTGLLVLVGMLLFGTLLWRSRRGLSAG